MAIFNGVVEVKGTIYVTAYDKAMPQLLYGSHENFQSDRDLSQITSK
jgi:hypothetical protein